MLTVSQFKRIVRKEIDRLDEGCGAVAAGGSKCGPCASGGGCGCSGHDDHDHSDGADYDVIYTSEMDHPDEIVSGYSDDLGLSIDPYDTYDMGPKHVGERQGHVPREETLDMVEELAGMTSCPKTRAALLAVVDELEYATGESGEDLDMDPHSAFGAGVEAGEAARDEFDYTGDLSGLPPDEAMGIGHQAGMMGLTRRGGG